MKHNSIFLSFLISGFFLLVSPALAQFTYNVNSPEVQFLIRDILKLPPEWGTNPSLFLFNFAVPFIALFAIILGAMRAIGVFRTQTSIQMVIAFAMAFLTIPSGFLVSFVQWTLALAGGIAYVLFLFLFLGGFYWYSKGFVWGHQGTATMQKAYMRQMKQLQLEQTQLGTQRAQLEAGLIKINEALANLDSQDPDYTNKKDKLIDKANALEDRIDKMKTRLDVTRDKIATLRQREKMYRSI